MSDLDYDSEEEWERERIGDWRRRFENSTGPMSLINRPDAFVIHCIRRFKRAESIKNITENTDGTFLVESAANANILYKVKFGTGVPSCGCPEWEKTTWPCKHVFSIIRHSKHVWEDIRRSYINYVCNTLDKTFNALRSKLGATNAAHEYSNVSMSGADWSFFSHCERRVERIESIKNITQNADGTFLVRSASDGRTLYKVEFGTDIPSCECPDWEKKMWPCKHIFSIIRHSKYRWEDITKSYVNSVCSTLDRIYSDLSPALEVTAKAGEQANAADGNVDCNTQGNCSVVLKEIESLTHVIHDEEIIKELKQKIEDIHKWVISKVSTCDVPEVENVASTSQNYSEPPQSKKIKPC